MKKSELMQLVGKRVKVTFKDGDEIQGVLGYTREFSEFYGWRKPKYFTLDVKDCDYDFLISHVKKVVILEE